MAAVDHIYVVDPFAKLPPSNKNITFLKNLPQHPLPVDYAFIITPVSTHCSTLKQVLKMNIQNIFIEKPAFQTTKEFEEIKPFIKNQKIVVGYILRQSQALKELKQNLKQALSEGYFIKNCAVKYVKNRQYPPQDKEDIGIFEEICHPLDLVFNYLDLKKAKTIQVKERYIETDPFMPVRHLTEKIKYNLSFTPTGNTPLLIDSSYNAIEKLRYFEFNLVKGSNIKKMVLSFDEADGFDKIKISQNSKTIYQNKSISHEKLIKQVEQVFSYFNTGNPNDLHLLEESVQLQKIIDLSRSAPCHKKRSKTLKNLPIRQNEK